MTDRPLPSPGAFRADLSPAGRGDVGLLPSLARIPPLAPGLRVGLYGGSFNPAHEAHRAASLLALKRLRLDRVWWLVTPGNPLKDNRALPPLDARLAQARAVADHPALVPTGLEAGLGTRFSFDTVAALVRRFPGVRFVWLMGADNLAAFHRWQHWREIAALVPIAIIDRPGCTFPAMASPAAQALARWRVPESEAAALPLLRPPAWVFLHGLKSPLSSTQLRAQG
ncbi:nicotinate-nucleotide adenylyltransferase [Ancylobacter polymorphus]|uniref:Probable nicotinate-nucleotide adenylyltransferase n=1 Tax=Ancylobacter polymorphus TaxID=223390 RepID=A0A9E6ZVL1_9HYPH|nr:nicotinate-nucleotide adenylyltransferase [Ancylobacter polymorphus]UOK72521.1 nicotinate-nucleotide adenylyltransferase [Ancylobacter polymorphus]